MSTPAKPPRPISFPMAQLRKLLSNLTGVPVKDPRRPVEQLGDSGAGEQAWIYARPTTRRALGVDEVRSNADATYTANGTTLPSPAPEDLVTSISGNRLQTVTLRAEVYDADVEPTDLLERVRMNLRTVTGYNGLTKLGLSISAFEMIADLGEDEDAAGNALLVAVMDVRFGWAPSLQATDDQVTTIDTVDGGTQAPGTATTIPGNVGGLAPLGPAFDSSIGGDGTPGGTQTLG